MIKKFIPTAVGLALCASVSLANANPTVLSSAKMDSVTAGGLLNVAPQTNVGPQANLNVLGFGVKQSNSQSNSSGKSGYDKGGHGGHDKGGHGGYDKHHAGYDKHGGGGDKWCGKDGGNHGNHGGNKYGGHGQNAHLVSFAPQTNVGPQANVNVLGFAVAQSNTQSNRN